MNAFSNQHPGQDTEPDRLPEAPSCSVLPSSHRALSAGDHLPDPESYPQVSQQAKRSSESRAERYNKMRHDRKCLGHDSISSAHGVWVAPLRIALTLSEGKPCSAASSQNQHQTGQGLLSVGVSRPPRRNVSLTFPVKGREFPPLASRPASWDRLGRQACEQMALRYLEGLEVRQEKV